MKLSPKAIRFVIEALSHYEQFQASQLVKPGLSDDELSDLTNDHLYLRSIINDLVRCQAENVQARESVDVDA